MIDPGHPRLSIVRQCALASISRSAFYREPTAESEKTLRLMRLIDEQFLETPWYGSRQMAGHLRRNSWCVGRHRVRRLMSKMGLAPSISGQRPVSRTRSTRFTGICCAI
jgi:putative transposase